MLCLVRSKKCLLEFLCCQLKHQTDVGCFGSIHLDVSELSQKQSDLYGSLGWLHLWLFLSWLKEQTGQTDLFSSLELHRECFPWKEEEDVFVIRPNFQGESTHHQQIPKSLWLAPTIVLSQALLHHQAVPDLLICNCAWKYQCAGEAFEIFSVFSRTADGILVPLILSLPPPPHLSMGKLYRRGILTKN